VALVLGASLAVAVIVGLLLQLTPGGIGPVSLDGSYAATLAVLSVVAMTRMPRREPGQLRRRSAAAARDLRRLLRWGLPVALAGLLGALAISTAHGSAVAVSKRSSFTQLWLIPNGDGAQVGVASFAHRAQRLVLVVTVGRSRISRSSVYLRPGSRFVKQLALSRRTVLSKRIEARLFLGDGTRPFRELSWAPPVKDGR
jgi:hypothetical protein